MILSNFLSRQYENIKFILFDNYDNIVEFNRLNNTLNRKFFLDEYFRDEILFKNKLSEKILSINGYDYFNRIILIGIENIHQKYENIGLLDGIVDHKIFLLLIDTEMYQIQPHIQFSMIKLMNKVSNEEDKFTVKNINHI